MKNKEGRGKRTKTERRKQVKEKTKKKRRKLQRGQRQTGESRERRRQKKENFSCASESHNSVLFFLLSSFSNLKEQKAIGRTNLHLDFSFHRTLHSQGLLSRMDFDLSFHEVLTFYWGWEVWFKFVEFVFFGGTPASSVHGKTPNSSSFNFQILSRHNAQTVENTCSSRPLSSQAPSSGEHLTPQARQTLFLYSCDLLDFSFVALTPDSNHIFVMWLFMQWFSS